MIISNDHIVANEDIDTDAYNMIVSVSLYDDDVVLQYEWRISQHMDEKQSQLLQSDCKSLRMMNKINFNTRY